jgi:hypothetical protein
VFEEAEKRIEFEAATDTGFVLGSAVKLPYDLVTGYYSVHTTADALRLVESNIAVIGRRLHNQGVLGPRANIGRPPPQPRPSILKALRSCQTGLQTKFA